MIDPESNYWGEIGARFPTSPQCGSPEFANRDGFEDFGEPRARARCRAVRQHGARKEAGFRDFSIDVGLPYAFSAPAFAHTASLWTLTPAVGFSYTPYAAPDPIVDPFVTRVDRQWRVSAGLDMTFYKNLGCTLQVQYLHTDSTLPNYRLQDFIVSAGPTFRF